MLSFAKTLSKFHHDIASYCKCQDINIYLLMMFTFPILAVFNTIYFDVWFDDLNLIYVFDQYVRRFGTYGAFWRLFIGDGLPNEYRTYGVSRVVHYCIWYIFGQWAPIYGLIMSAGNCLLAYCYYLLVKHLINDRFLLLCTCIVLIFAPWSMTQCFHHWSYLIFPFILSLLLVHAILKNAPFVALALSLCVGLTGESHLLALLTIQLIIATLSWRKKNAGVAILAILSMVFVLFSIGAHYLLWHSLVYDPSIPPRFLMSGKLDFNTIQIRVWLFIKSVPIGFLHDMKELYILISTYSATRVMIVSVIFLMLIIIDVMLHIQYSRENITNTAFIPITSHNDYHFILIGITALGICVLILLPALIVGALNDVYRVLPRRYGLVAYSTLFIASSMCIFVLFNIATARVLLLTFSFLVVYSFLGLWETRIIVKTEDKPILSAILTAGSQKQGVVFFDVQTFPALQGNETFGPATSGLRGEPMNVTGESPLMSMAIQGDYAMNVAGCPFATNKVNVTAKGGEDGEIFDWRLWKLRSVNLTSALFLVNEDPVDRNTIHHALPFSVSQYHSLEAVMSQSMGLYGIKVARGGIERSYGRLMAVINLGRKDRTMEAMLPDKNWSEAEDEATEPTGIEKYGFVTGQDRLFTVRGRYWDPYYASNRHGNFEYRLRFKEPTTGFIVLDAQELFRTKPGERSYTLDVSYDSGSWVKAATIDSPFFSAGHPFSIIIGLLRCHEFAFKLQKTQESLDIPFLNGIRVFEK